jgi:hypothetical protein
MILGIPEAPSPTRLNEVETQNTLQYNDSKINNAYVNAESSKNNLMVNTYKGHGD